MTTVRLGNIDISRFVVAIPRIAEQTADYGQLLVMDMPTLTGENSQGFWHERNPSSPFHGADINEMFINIENDDLLVWTGLIQGIRSDGSAKTAEITLRSEIQRKLDSGCIYVSGTATNPSDTPAGIARAICELYGIPIDSSSFGQSHGIYTVDNVLLSSTMITPETTIRDALQQLAQIGAARIFWSDGRMHFDVWTNTLTPPIAIFTDTAALALASIPAVGRLMTPPTIEPLEKQVTNGYSVQWLGGSADFGTEPISISAGPDAPFQIRSLQGAVWLGERWLDYMQTAQQRISFAVSAQYGRVLKLGFPIAIEHSAHGWSSNEVIDIVSIDNSSILSSIIT